MEDELTAQIEEMLKPMLSMAERMAPEVARLQKLYLTELLGQGFSRDEALKIMCSNPLLGNNKQS